MEIWVHLLKEPHMYLHVVFGEQIALFKEFMVIVDPERMKTELFGRLKFDNTVLEVLVKVTILNPGVSIFHGSRFWLKIIGEFLTSLVFFRFEASKMMN